MTSKFVNCLIRFLGQHSGCAQQLLFLPDPVKDRKEVQAHSIQLIPAPVKTILFEIFKLGQAMYANSMPPNTTMELRPSAQFTPRSHKH
jgi:hypothetical protein